MSVRVPPPIATWLLRRFGPLYQHESLAGDLYEEYQANRTRAWYWKQVLAAICVGWDMDARRVVRRLGVKRLLGVFVVTALGAGTLTWARGISHRPAQCAAESNAAVTTPHTPTVTATDCICIQRDAEQCQ